MLIIVYWLLIWLDVLNTHWNLWSKSYKSRFLFDSFSNFLVPSHFVKSFTVQVFFPSVHEKHFYAAIFPLIIICPLIMFLLLVHFIYICIYLINFSTSEYDLNLYKLLKIWNCQVIWVCTSLVNNKNCMNFPSLPLVRLWIFNKGRIASHLLVFSLY